MPHLKVKNPYELFLVCRFYLRRIFNVNFEPKKFDPYASEHPAYNEALTKFKLYEQKLALKHIVEPMTYIKRHSNNTPSQEAFLEFNKLVKDPVKMRQILGETIWLRS